MMTASMTGFGRAIKEANYGRVIVEIQAVNRKYLEVFVSLPKEYSRFEHEVRKIVGENVIRGQISIRIYVLPNTAAVEQSLPDLKLLKALKKGWEKIGSELGYDKKAIDLPFLLHQISQGSRAELAKDEDFTPMKECLHEALQAFHKMRMQEGSALVKDIKERLKALGRLLREIELLAPEVVSKMRKKLKEKMDETLEPGTSLDERLLREVALFAEKADISEEITRFTSHLDQYDELLKEKKGGTGRKMDFLIQEMGREVNTIGSKALEAKISHHVVEMKSELEKIREQIQNIE